MKKKYQNDSNTFLSTFDHVFLGTVLLKEAGKKMVRQKNSSKNYKIYSPYNFIKSKHHSPKSLRVLTKRSWGQKRII